MKKIFLVLTLLVSGFGFADFNISTLHCDLLSDSNPVDISDEITVRLDEKKKTMRVDLFPETKYKEIRDDQNNPELKLDDTWRWDSQFKWNTMLYEISLYFDMSFTVKVTRRGETFENVYACRII